VDHLEEPIFANRTPGAVELRWLWLLLLGWFSAAKFSRRPRSGDSKMVKNDLSSPAAPVMYASFSTNLLRDRCKWNYINHL